MNAMTVTSGTTAGVALIGSAIGLGFLSQSSAHSVSSLSSANTPLMDVAPTVKELSDSETSKSTQLADVSDSTTVEPEYTQKQLECAERLGVDPLECTVKGRLIRKRKNVSKDHTVQKRSEPTEAQEECASTLGVSVDECNQYGVYTNRTQVVAEKILGKFPKDFSWANMTFSNLGSIDGVLDLENFQLSSLKPHDFQGLVNLTQLWMNNNPELKEIPQGLTSHLNNTYKITLAYNEFTELPDDIFDGEAVRSLELWNTPVTLSEYTLKSLLAKDYLFIFYIDQSFDWKFVEVTLGNETARLVNFVNLFKNGDSDPEWILLSSPRLGASGANLDPQNRRFVCIYLQDELREKGYLPEGSGSGMESIEECEDSDYFKPSPEPTQTPTPTPSSEPTFDPMTPSSSSSAASHRGLIGNALHIIKGAVSYLN